MEEEAKEEEAEMRSEIENSGKEIKKKNWWRWGGKESEEAERKGEEMEREGGEREKGEEEGEEVQKRRPILMVRSENVDHKPFKQTEEVRALSAEVIKTIRDIVALNPLYRYMYIRIYRITSILYGTFNRANCASFRRPYKIVSAQQFFPIDTPTYL